MVLRCCANSARSPSPGRSGHEAGNVGPAVPGVQALAAVVDEGQRCQVARIDGLRARHGHPGQAGLADGRPRPFERHALHARVGDCGGRLVGLEHEGGAGPLAKAQPREQAVAPDLALCRRAAAPGVAVARAGGEQHAGAQRERLTAEGQVVTPAVGRAAQADHRRAEAEGALIRCSRRRRNPASAYRPPTPRHRLRPGRRGRSARPVTAAPTVQRSCASGRSRARRWRPGSTRCRSSRNRRCRCRLRRATAPRPPSASSRVPRSPGRWRCRPPAPAPRPRLDRAADGRTGQGANGFPQSGFPQSAQAYRPKRLWLATGQGFRTHCG